VICIASIRLLIAGSRSVSASALLKRSTMARGVRPAVKQPHHADDGHYDKSSSLAAARPMKLD
jgi:hypothetical protein